MRRDIDQRLPALALTLLAAHGLPAAAASWNLQPSIQVQETWTSNVNLTTNAQSDFVTQITPALTVQERGANTTLQGSIAAPLVVYARTGAENNNVYPSVNLLGDVNFFQKALVIEGAINVSQQYFTPFGAQPVGLTNATQNRYTSASYRVSPFFQGTTPGGTKYLVRNDNLWTNLSGAPIATQNAYYDDWNATVSNTVYRLGWEVDGDWNRVKFPDQTPTTTQLARAKALYRVDPQLGVDVDGGYEDNQYPLVDYRGPIYGAGFRWTPTERTNVVANWEHRFFGSSYLFTFDHRRPLSAINISFSRNTTSYPQQFLSLPATGNLPLLLFFLFSSAIPDPATRVDFITKLINDRGLPTTLTGPVNLYTQQTYLLENANATVGLLGARNSVFLTVFYVKTQPITGAGTPLPGFLAASNNNTQNGVSLSWSHNVSAQVALTASGTVLHTTANAPLVGKTNQGIVTVGVTATVSPRTVVFGGARYQTLSSDVTSGYDEGAVFAGITYTFK